MTWMTFKVDGIIEAGTVTRQMQEYSLQPRLFMRFADPTVAFFSSTDIHNDSQRFFITPSAVDIFRPFIEKYGGYACEPPRRGPPHDRGISLLQGDARAWDLIAPADQE